MRKVDIRVEQHQPQKSLKLKRLGNEGHLKRIMNAVIEGIDRWGGHEQDGRMCSEEI